MTETRVTQLPTAVDRPAKAHLNALPSGYSLHWYEIQAVLGQGAFGITYRALDVNLNRPVAIKEFLPGQLARRQDETSVQALSEDLRDEYAWGLERFISEARTLAQFEHPNIVRVHNVFEANNTAYMVMNYEEGESLEEILKRQGTLSEVEALDMLFPLLGGLQMIHNQGFVHRDIKPGNIYLRKDGTPVLLDFGSARQAMQDHTRTLTNFVSPGYAPIEQYTGKSDKQGPWTDIYGLGATLYRALLGQAPSDAVERGESIAHDAQDVYLPGVERGRGHYSEELLAAIDHALRFRTQDRPQSVAEWRRDFEFVVNREAETREVPREAPGSAPQADDDPATVPVAGASAPPGGPARGAVSDRENATTVRQPPPAAAGTRRGWLLGGALVLVVLVALVAVISMQSGPPSRTGTDAAVTQTPPPATPTPTPASAAAPSPTETAVEPRRVPAASPEPNAAPEVARLIVAAGKDLAALRLTTPPGANAYEKYREALAIEPGNAEAQRGLNAIVDKYIELVYRDIAAKRFDRAEQYLDRAAQIAPEHDALAQARADLVAGRKRRDETSNGAFTERMEKLKRRFGEFVKEQEAQQTEDKRGDSFLKALGGSR